MHTDTACVWVFVCVLLNYRRIIPFFTSLNRIFSIKPHWWLNLHSTHTHTTLPPKPAQPIYKPFHYEINILFTTTPLNENRQFFIETTADFWCCCCCFANWGNRIWSVVKSVLKFIMFSIFMPYCKLYVYTWSAMNTHSIYYLSCTMYVFNFFCHCCYRWWWWSYIMTGTKNYMCVRINSR